MSDTIDHLMNEYRARYNKDLTSDYQFLREARDDQNSQRTHFQSPLAARDLATYEERLVNFEEKLGLFNMLIDDRKAKKLGLLNEQHYRDEFQAQVLACKHKNMTEEEINTELHRYDMNINIHFPIILNRARNAVTDQLPHVQSSAIQVQQARPVAARQM